VKVSGQWRYVYRGIDQFGQVIDVFVSARRDTMAAHRFFRRAIGATKLAPFHMRPHWGNLLHMNAATIATLDERHGDFVRLQERLDPRGAFRNQWLQTHVLGNA
jgi:hypothetical protein